METLTSVLQYTGGKLIKVIDEGLLVKNKGVATERDDMSLCLVRALYGYIRCLTSHSMGVSQLNTIHRRLLENYCQFCSLS